MIRCRDHRERAREKGLNASERVRQIAGTWLGHILAPWKEAHYGIARGDAARLSTRPHRASPRRGEGCPGNGQPSPRRGEARWGEGCPFPGHFREDLARLDSGP